MKTLLALVALATLSLLSISGAHAESPVRLSVTVSTQAVAAGRDAIFVVKASGDDPSSLDIDYRVEGGALSGVLSLNDTAPGEAQASVYVTRSTPGEATLIVNRDGVDVARATATFVQGAPISLSLQLHAPANAAARTFYFEVLDANARLVDVIQVGLSGDAPFAAGTSLPLPLADYLVRPAPSHDVAGSCGGRALYAMTPAGGVQIAPGTDWLASFEVRPCAALPDGIGVEAPYDPHTPAPGVIDEVAAVRSGSAPLPPATGNGQAEKPALPEGHAFQLFGMLLALILGAVLVVLAARALAHVAPVRKPESKR